MAIIYIGTKTKNLPDSGAWQIHKFGTASGEQRIALDGSWTVDSHVFDFFVNDVEFYFFTKSDLLDYISSIQEEINHPTQKYRYSDYPLFYKDKIDEIKNLPDDFISLHFQKNPRTGGTSYLAATSMADSEKYNFFRSICLSSSKPGKNNAYTTYHFIKYQDTLTGKFYINMVPVFSKKYSLDELSNILKREMFSSSDSTLTLNMFTLKYADQIIDQSIDVVDLLRKSGQPITYADQMNSILKLYKELQNQSITINPISDKIGMLGAYLYPSSTSSILRALPANYPLQQIYYGAPGTGKSFEINREVVEKGYDMIRTTFHPDSDYSTFVGAYKPTMDEVEARVVPVVLNNGAVFNQNEGTYKETRIVYKFIKQAFLKAYLSAWKKYSNNPESPNPQFLVIEEINRGNCAQIFGDLFQLLDRADNGFSCYPIEADSDIQQEIARCFAPGGEYELGAFDIEGVIDGYTSNYGKTLSEDVKEGRVMLLPNNLYIWATMNTSDQSLFPIDSAFKRRWDWKYMPIDTQKENWSIVVGNKSYSWGDFLEKINKEIQNTTSSEDKQLGFYFCKAHNKEINVERFVNKVLFYIYNDVFNDYSLNCNFLKHKEGNTTIAFNEFFSKEGIRVEIVAELLDNLGVKENAEVDFPAGEKFSSEVMEQHIKFWNDLFEWGKKNNVDFKTSYNGRKIYPRGCYSNFSIDEKDCNIVINIAKTNEIAYSLYFAKDKTRYYQLKNKKEEIEQKCQYNFAWVDDDSQRVYVSTTMSNININTTGNEREVMLKVVIDELFNLKAVFKELLAEL